MTSMSETQMSGQADLLLRETNHRCANDLQLVVSLLALQSRKAALPETRAALDDAAARVAVLARARSELSRQQLPSLETALRQVCEALHSQAEPRGIIVSLQVEQDVPGLSPDRITPLTLAVNELATNAIKHAFREEKGGRILIDVRSGGRDGAFIVVDDDGLPLPDGAGAKGDGMGFGLVNRLVASAGGTLRSPVDGTKRLEIEIPVQPG